MASKAFTILVVGAMKSSLIQAVQKLSREHPALGTPVICLLTTDPKKYSKFEADGVTVLSCDFSPDQIQGQLAVIGSPIKAVVCRGDKYIQYLRELVPYLPDNVPVSSERALAISTNKRLMREAFDRTCPQYTPKHIAVKSTDDTDLAAAKLTFPVVVKPASLASSLLIRQCDNTAQLRAALKQNFKQLESVYKREGRTEKPELIVEEFLEGDFYSIDSYVLVSGKIWHTPPVYYVPAKQLGIDDFYLYKRLAPTDLSESDSKAAETAAEAAIQAVGLSYSSVHVELIRTKNGNWKIIEVGPRLGRFRNIMYRQAFGIDHGYNDLLIHVGLEPIVPTKPKAYCAAYSIYPSRDGLLKQVSGLGRIRSNIQRVRYFVDNSKPGTKVLQAKNGGHALCEVIFSAKSKTRLMADCRWFETHVRAELEPTPTKRKPAVVGGLLKVSLPSLSIINVLAKVDTGAYSGALHCSGIEERDGELHFTPLGKPKLATSTKLYQRRLVRSANGQMAKRYLIPVRLLIRGKSYDTLIGLSERANMKREMLIGRRFLLDHNILVDVQLTKEIDFEAKVKS